MGSGAVPRLRSSVSQQKPSGKRCYTPIVPRVTMTRILDAFQCIPPAGEPPATRTRCHASHDRSQRLFNASHQRLEIPQQERNATRHVTRSISTPFKAPHQCFEASRITTTQSPTNPAIPTSTVKLSTFRWSLSRLWPSDGRFFRASAMREEAMALTTNGLLMPRWRVVLGGKNVGKRKDARAQKILWKPSTP